LRWRRQQDEGVRRPSYEGFVRQERPAEAPLAEQMIPRPNVAVNVGQLFSIFTKGIEAPVSKRWSIP
jgi:hypothetical protein